MGLVRGDPEGYGEEDSGDGHVLSPATLRDSCKGALEMGHLSVWELC